MDGEGVLALVVAGPVPARVRWWRRQPPAELPGFARVVWWAGHAQLFIAVFLTVVAPVVLLLSQLMVPVSSAGSMVGWLGTAMALPFAASGSMLRGYAVTEAARVRNVALRVLWLALVVALIAAVSIVFTFFCALGIIMFVMSLNHA